ncbi:MAG TPA: DNA replication/repair protein RecF [Steroidobacteraceae bacterium]|nr:DNA replication/repair protein RecF [Steroidobacteraceae bacterium]
MALAELRIENLRCIESAGLEFSPELNLISGANGAGKTSVLEAIFLLGRGRSFRTRSSDKLIRHGKHSLVVFGRTDASLPQTAGVEVTREGTRARINGGNAESLLALSSVLPVQSIDPEIHKLIDHGPERRRRWLDWLVFHVEPTFGIHWSRYQRALKQRNAALKVKGADIGLWDAALIEHGQAMTLARGAAIERLEPYLQKLFGRFAGLDVGLGFYAGWGQDHDLAEALRLSVDRDRERGTSTSGPHRADIPLRLKGRSARETASRGQQKLIAVAMIVSQLQLLKAELGTQAVLLLDDPAAELDSANLALLFEELAALECQMIATSLSPEITLFQAPKTMFHVEQGRVIRL